MADRIEKPRGTNDLFGDDKRLYDSLVAELSSAALRFGASPIEPPHFEEEALFVRGVGESSDIVSKEMFRLAVKGEHDYVLRPEYTAGVNRLVIENKLYASPDLPLRFYYAGPVFRFERPQKGRLRELHQFGIEFLDTQIDQLTALDAVLLFYRGAEEALGRELLLKINYLGSFASREKYKAALKAFYQDKLPEMCEDCHRRFETNVLRILDCKVPSDIEINKDAPFITDYLEDEDEKRLEETEKALEALNIPYKLEPRLVRGLDYYTGLVFELYDPVNMDLGAIGGGGQYGSLMEEIGGPSFEGIGFSYGIERLMMSLDQEAKDRLIKADKPPLDYFIIDLRKEKDLVPVILMDELRSAGRLCSASSYQKALSGSLKMADRLHGKVALIFDDYNPGMVIVKDMLNREQDVIKADEAENILAYLMKKEKKAC